MNMKTTGSLLEQDSLLSASASDEPTGGRPSPPSAKAEPKLTLYSLVAPLGLLVTRKMQLIIPAIIYSGVSQGLIFGDFPPLIADKQWKFFVMAAFGAADVASSIILGKASDKIGRKLVVLIGFVVHFTGYLFWYFYEFNGDEYGCTCVCRVVSCRVVQRCKHFNRSISVFSDLNRRYRFCGGGGGE